MVTAPRELPAVLPGLQGDDVRRYASAVAELCAVRGVARLDFLANDHELYVNEINTIPGSLARHLWVDPPIAFGVLLTDLLAEAAARPTTAWTTAGADGTALRSAGTIASKLG
jgi:D-alanine-D-alanine ligase